MNTNLKISAVTLAFGKAAVAGQLNLICAMSLEIAPLMEINPKFRMAQYARDVEEASGYSISKKTLENAGAVARKFCTKFGQQIGTYGDISEANVLLFAEFIKEQVAKTTYNLTVMELSAWCDGKKSAADERAEKAAAMLKEQAERMAAADKAAEAVQAQGDKAPEAAPAEQAPAEQAPAPEAAPEAAPIPVIEMSEQAAEVITLEADLEEAQERAEKLERALWEEQERTRKAELHRDADPYAAMLALADKLDADSLEKFAAAMLELAAQKRAAVAPVAAPKQGRTRKEKIAA